MPNSLENIATNGVGIAGGVAARARGLTGVFNKLAQQHREVATLLNRLQNEEDPDRRAELWATVRRELLSHERAELGTVYPVLEEYAATVDVSERHADDAIELESAIAELEVAGPSSSSWPSALQRLAEMVQHHVDEEEHDFFPRAQQALSRRMIDDLEAQFLAAKERILEELA